MFFYLFEKENKNALNKPELIIVFASRRSSVDPIAEGKKFPKVSRKSCGRSLKSGSENPKGKKNRPQQHSSNKETEITYSTSKVQEVEN